MTYIALMSTHDEVSLLISVRENPAPTGVCIKALSGWGIAPGVLATQKVDVLPVAGVDPIGVVVTVSTNGVEQFPPGEDAVERVWAMCLQTIVHGVTWTWSTGALSTVLVEIVQARW
jgi:hypothetical protein